MTGRGGRLAAGAGLALLLAGATAVAAVLLRGPAPEAPFEPPPPALPSEEPSPVQPAPSPEPPPAWVLERGTVPDSMLHTIVPCNRGDVPVFVAFGYRTTIRWIATGWIEIPANRCSAPLAGLAGTVYAHATTGRRHWAPAGESLAFCVLPSSRFTLARLACTPDRPEAVVRAFGLLVSGPARDFTWTIPAFDTPAVPGTATGNESAEALSMLLAAYGQPAERGSGSTGPFATVSALFVEPWDRNAANAPRAYFLLGDPAGIGTERVAAAVHERFESAFRLAGVRATERVAVLAVDCPRRRYAVRRIELFDRTGQPARPERVRAIEFDAASAVWTTPAGNSAGAYLLGRLCP